MPQQRFLSCSAVCIFLVTSLFVSSATAQVPDELEHWLGPQNWRRDVDGPVLSLGKMGEFDDTHIFAPMVAADDGQYLLWYCGSQGFAHDLSPMRTPDERVFGLGLATSADGMRFEKHPGGAVYALDEDRLSTDAPEGAHRGIHPARDELLGAGEDFLGKRAVHAVVLN